MKAEIVSHTCKWVYPGIRYWISFAARSTMTRRSALTELTMSSVSPMSHSRMSVATWSFRERPVCNLPPTGPTSSVSRRSFAVWISSSPGWTSNYRCCLGICTNAVTARTYDALLPLSSNTRQSVYDLVLLILGKDPALRQRACVGDGARDISGVHPPVISERLVELVHTDKTRVSTTIFNKA